MKKTPLAFGELFRPFSQRVQRNFISNDNVRILCLSCNVKKSENSSDLNKKNRNKINDPPLSISNCNTDMYADDSTIPISGGNISDIQTKVQEDLNRIFFTNGML
jgi:hypothetical protein